MAVGFGGPRRSRNRAAFQHAVASFGLVSGAAIRKGSPADTASGAGAVVTLSRRTRPKVDAQANSQSLRTRRRSPSLRRHTHVIRHHAA
jgi:hypothetical protein